MPHSELPSRKFIFSALGWKEENSVVWSQKSLMWVWMIGTGLALGGGEVVVVRGHTGVEVISTVCSSGEDFWGASGTPQILSEGLSSHKRTETDHVVRKEKWKKENEITELGGCTNHAYNVLWRAKKNSTPVLHWSCYCIWITRLQEGVFLGTGR